MKIQEKIENAFLIIQNKRGIDYTDEIKQKTKNLNNNIKLKTLQNIIEFDDILYPSTINDDSLEKELLLKLEKTLQKKEVILEILNNLNISEQIKKELIKYEDILLEIKNEK